MHEKLDVLFSLRYVCILKEKLINSNESFTDENMVKGREGITGERKGIFKKQSFWSYLYPPKFPATSPSLVPLDPLCHYHSPLTPSEWVRGSVKWVSPEKGVFVVILNKFIKVVGFCFYCKLNQLKCCKRKGKLRKVHTLQVSI